jgi:hypothetical protein
MSDEDILRTVSIEKGATSTDSSFVQEYIEYRMQDIQNIEDIVEDRPLCLALVARDTEEAAKLDEMICDLIDNERLRQQWFNEYQPAETEQQAIEQYIAENDIDTAKLAILDIYFTQLSAPITQEMEHVLSQGQKRISRRRALQLIAGSLGALIAWGALDGRIRKAFESSVKGRDPIKIDEEEKARFNVECLKEAKARTLYREIYGAKSDLLSFQTWKKTTDYLSHLAQVLYFPKEGEGQTKEDFTMDFIRRAAEISEEMDFDPLVSLQTLRYSAATQYAPDIYNRDIKVENVRMLGLAFAERFGILGLNEEFLASLSSDDSNVALVLRKFNKEFPFDPYSAMRLRSIPTIGINDYQISETATAVFAVLSDTLLDPLRERYPQEIDSLQKVVEAKENFRIQRAALTKQIDDFVDKYKTELGEIFYEFRDTDQPGDSFKTVMAEIGITSPIDSWQKINPTFTAAYLQRSSQQESDIPQDQQEEDITNKVLDEYQLLCQKSYLNPEEDLGVPLRRLFYNQIRNPKFRKFLKDRFGENKQAARRVQDMKRTEREMNRLAEALQEANFNAVTEVGQREFDSDFQLRTGLAMLKYQQEKFVTQMGDADLSSRDGVAWHIFGIMLLREIISPTLLSYSEIGPRDVRVEPFRDDGAMFRHLQKFIDIVKTADEDFDPRTDFIYFTGILGRSETDNFSDMPELQGVSYGLKWIYTKFLQSVGFATGWAYADRYIKGV